LADRSLRIALLSYRSHPEVGGQGVYVRALGRALTSLGHRVTVFSGPPHPELDPGVGLERVPSLDLYRPDDPFRRPRLKEFHDSIDVLEYGLMCTGAFPEPLAFSLRVARLLSPRANEFDIVHDNQTLAYGSLALAHRMPLLATVHHPISVDRRLALRAARSFRERTGKRRWYGFVRMQARVARRLPALVAVSDSARRDLIADFGVAADRIHVVPNGVDTDLFCPLPDVRRIPGRLIAIASSDQPAKGLEHLVEAVAKVRTEKNVHLVVIGKGGQGENFRRAVQRFGVSDHVITAGRVPALSLVEHMARAEVAVVPSLYEGFSLPAVEAMSCGVPLIATNGGALPEVVGDAAVVTSPRDAWALASAIGGLLDDPARREVLAAAGRRRALARYSWETAAASMVERYRSVIASC
jgi:glycosyltransferase involved in cell wall biosynthesis